MGLATATALGTMTALGTGTTGTDGTGLAGLGFASGIPGLGPGVLPDGTVLPTLGGINPLVPPLNPLLVGRKRRRRRQANLTMLPRNRWRERRENAHFMGHDGCHCCCNGEVNSSVNNAHHAQSLPIGVCLFIFYSLWES